MKLPHLNWLERWALRLLHRSPRMALVIAKPVNSTLISWSALEDDELAMVIAEDLLLMPDDDEPLSMQLERIYHQPSYGERE
jgi:hypothetical protein